VTANGAKLVEFLRTNPLAENLIKSLDIEEESMVEKLIGKE
jgi:hypothetical protein